MNPVKKGILITAVLLLFGAYVYAVFFNFNSQGVTYELNAERAYFYLGKKTKRQDLEHLQMVFKAQKNIDIDFSGSTFGFNGQVLQLKLKVDDNQGTLSSTACSPFQPTQYKKNLVSDEIIIGKATKASGS